MRYGLSYVVIAVGVLFLCAPARAQDNGADDEARFKLPRGVRRIDGRVKDIDPKLMKIAVEVEVEPDKPAEILIFQMTGDTKVRKAEHAMSVDDIRKGNPVLVWYVPSAKKGEPGKAVLIRVFEGLRDYPLRPRPRPR